MLLSSLTRTLHLTAIKRFVIIMHHLMNHNCGTVCPGTDTGTGAKKKQKKNNEKNIVASHLVFKRHLTFMPRILADI